MRPEEGWSRTDWCGVVSRRRDLGASRTGVHPLEAWVPEGPRDRGTREETRKTGVDSQPDPLSV